MEHAPAPGSTANGPAIVHLTRVVGHALPGESFDCTTPTGGTLRSAVYDTKAVVPMPVARETAGAVGQRDEHAWHRGCGDSAAMGQRTLQRTRCAKAVILRALGPLGAGPEEEESTFWESDRRTGAKAATGVLVALGPWPAAAVLSPWPAPLGVRLDLTQRAADPTPAAIQDVGTGQASCEASIGCIRCSSGLGLRDWKSPNPQSSRKPAG
jgi:hypothetical protein